jgi:hypothetical protein
VHIPPLPAPVSRRHRCVAGFGVLVCLALAWGCSKQGEGERCDLNNVDLDCETGLVCRGEAELSIVGRGFAVCCPRPPLDPSVDACRGGVALPPEATLPPDELPEPPAAQPDAGGQTPTPDAGNVPQVPVVLDAGDGGT